MKIYIDTEFKCHTESAVTYREFDVDFFNNKCSTFIEGYRYVPQSETWTREDGTEFHGEMISPWIDYRILAEAQRNYDEGISVQQEIIDIITKGVAK